MSLLQNNQGNTALLGALGMATRLDDSILNQYYRDTIHVSFIKIFSMVYSNTTTGIDGSQRKTEHYTPSKIALVQAFHRLLRSCLNNFHRSFLHGRPVTLPHFTRT